MSPHRPLVALVLTPLLLLASCAHEADQTYRYTRFAMGTTVEYTIVAPSRTAAQDAMLAAHAEIERVASLLWEEDPRSRIHALNRSPDSLVLDPETFAFLRRALDYGRRTGGAFDVTIGAVLELYPFEAGEPRPPEAGAVDDRLALVGPDRLQLHLPSTAVKAEPGVRVAVGGVAKGYAVDRAVEILRSRGIRSAIVNAGGDLYALGMNGDRPWTVGIRHPDDPDALVDTLHVADRAVATSGDYQRFFVYDGERIHHLLDPQTGRPARRVRSATVTARSAEKADALATALFVLGRDGLPLIEALPDATGTVWSEQSEPVRPTVSDPRQRN